MEFVFKALLIQLAKSFVGVIFGEVSFGGCLPISLKKENDYGGVKERYKNHRWSLVPFGPAHIFSTVCSGWSGKMDTPRALSPGLGSGR